MSNCANCEKEVEDGDMENVQVLHGPIDIVICTACQKNVLTMKIVLSRASPKENFGFEQYLPVASVKS